MKIDGKTCTLDSTQTQHVFKVLFTATLCWWCAKHANLNGNLINKPLLCDYGDSSVVHITLRSVIEHETAFKPILQVRCSFKSRRRWNEQKVVFMLWNHFVHDTFIERVNECRRREPAIECWLRTFTFSSTLCHKIVFIKCGELRNEPSVINSCLRLLT